MTESIFAHVTAVADDPILSLTGKFLADPRECKVNLGVGMYLDENVHKRARFTSPARDRR